MSESTADLADEQALAILSPEEAPPVADVPVPADVPADDAPSPLDALIEGVDAEQRAALVDGLLAKMTPEERLALGSVNDVLTPVAKNARDQAYAEAQRAAERHDYEADVEKARQALYESTNESNWKKFETAVSERAAIGVAGNLINAAWTQVKHTSGIDEAKLPADMKESLRAAPNQAAYLQRLIAINDSIAFQQGRDARDKEVVKTTKAEDVIREQSLYKSVLDRLAKGERIIEATAEDGTKTYTYKKDDLPPAISAGTASLAGGRVAVPEYASEEELLNAAMANITQLRRAR